MEYNELCVKFGNKLKYYRLMRGYTQEKLAEKLGIDAHYISDIECGLRNITFKTLHRLVSALDVEPYKFFNFDWLNFSLDLEWLSSDRIYLYWF